MHEILEIYVQQLDWSKESRIEGMYEIVRNLVYERNFTIEERIIASKLITKILKEK